MNFAEGWLTAFVWDIGSMAGQSLGPGCAKRDMGKPMKYSTDGLKKKQIRTLVTCSTNSSTNKVPVFTKISTQYGHSNHSAMPVKSSVFANCSAFGVKSIRDRSGWGLRRNIGDLSAGYGGLPILRCKNNVLNT